MIFIAVNASRLPSAYPSNQCRDTFASDVGAKGRLWKMGARYLSVDANREKRKIECCKC